MEYREIWLMELPRPVMRTVSKCTPSPIVQNTLVDFLYPI